MHRIFIIAKEPEKAGELDSGLTRMGFACFAASNSKDTLEQVTERAFDLLLVDMDGSPASAWTESVWRQIRDIQPKRQLPVIAIISREILDGLDSDVGMEDFVVTPLDLSELAIRIKRTIGRTNNIHSEELIRCGDLTIDLAKCEVAIDSRLLALTFKEYQLLKFLASNRGRVFTRQTLLNEVWGYDYYGGDRTVDVHIRRLRSKIEDSTHTFIETVRNIGYRLR